MADAAEGDVRDCLGPDMVNKCPFPIEISLSKRSASYLMYKTSDEPDPLAIRDGFLAHKADGKPDMLIRQLSPGQRIEIDKDYELARVSIPSKQLPRKKKG
jgi:hypothetical protein